MARISARMLGWGCVVGLLLLGLLLAGGCAGAMPLVGAASTTPSGRTDLVAGGSARLGFGALRSSSAVRDDVRARPAPQGGIAPLASVRVGLPRHHDLGLLASGTMARLDMRREWVQREGSTRMAWMLAPALHAGGFSGRTDEGNTVHAPSAGAEIHALWTVQVGGVYEAWMGPALGAHRLWHERLDTQATLRCGGVFGMAMGLGHFHAGIELSAHYEHHRLRDVQASEADDRTRSRGGAVLTPAFFVRLRL